MKIIRIQDYFIALKILGRPFILTLIILMLLLFASSLFFSTLMGLINVMDVIFGSSSENVIMQYGARTVFSSNVPVSLASDLRLLPGVSARAEIVTIATINGKPAIIRAFDNEVEYFSNVIKGRINNSGAWILLGKKLYEQLNVKVGQIISVAGVNSKKPTFLYVAGVYEFGDFRDYEAIVPIWIGRIIAGKGNELVSLIRVEGISRDKLNSIISKKYTVTINYEKLNGTLIVFDRSGNEVARVKVKGKGSVNLKLGFGFYSIKYEQDYFITNITSLLIKEKTKLSVKPDMIKRVKLIVNSPYAVLISGNNRFYGSTKEETTIFEVPQGLYTLRVDNQTYDLVLIGDTQFKTVRKSVKRWNVKVSVKWSDGRPLNNYLISVYDSSLNLIFSRISHESTISFDLPSGEYEIKIERPPYTIVKKINVFKNENVTVNIRTIPEPSRLSPSTYAKFKAFSPVDITKASINALLGLPYTTLLIMTTVPLILSIMTIFILNYAFARAVQRNIENLRRIGATNKSLIKLFAFPTLSLNILIALVSAVLITINPIDLAHFIGYSLKAPNIIIYLYSLSLGISSWGISLLRILRT